MWRILLVTLACLTCVGPARGLDYVTFRQDKKDRKVAGKLLLKAQDGGVMILGRDGMIWAVQPEEQVEISRDDEPFEPYTPEELAKHLLAELPKGFEAHHTAHYVILYNTSREYAQWCGALFEKLYGAFKNYWTRKGFELNEPAFPLVAIVFADRASYIAHAKAEVGDGARSIIGYFSMKTDRMTMFDLSETNGSSSGRGRGRAGAGAINRILSQPDAAWNVATIVHEATHQIAFNCGLHTRFSDCPRWFSEGIAMYFETPDLNNSKGWRISSGTINRPRAEQFHTYLKKRPADSLTKLLTDDKRFTDTQNALDAYAEAWSLTYFLINQYSKQYVAYLETLSAKKPMVWDDAKTRLQDFKDAFGDDLEKLDREFVNYMLRRAR